MARPLTTARKLRAIETAAGSRLLAGLLALPFLLPAAWRAARFGLSQPAGLLSDLAVGLMLTGAAWYAPRLPRSALVLLWAVFQIGARELYGAVRRLPSWQDAQYAFDPTFLQGSMDGLHLAAPGFAAAMLIAAAAAVALPLRRCGGRAFAGCLAASVVLLFAHGRTAGLAGVHDIAGRYQALHWLVTDSMASVRLSAADRPGRDALPQNLTAIDLDGKPLLAPGRGGRDTNVLLVVLEGIPGIYLPDIRRSVTDKSPGLQMHALAQQTLGAMLVPDFVAHSHQTIRGLYAIHCGDFSKLSYGTPKAFELSSMPERAGQCLPAQLARNGWETHYLQGAPLQFMNKDRAMPVMGFKEVHGLEWFTERTTTDFIWGTSDEDFFRGAAAYIRALQQRDGPWFLSLLTVATHQPYAASEEDVLAYGSRHAAAVARLDQASAGFIRDLRREGVLDNTLVIITSDESHGAEGADWYTSWGLAMVLAPERAALPRVKSGTYGLVDIEASILDYLELAPPAGIVGRSLFRDYDRPRDMVSYTSSLLRWQTADNRLFECGRDGLCRVAADAGMIARRPERFDQAAGADARRLFALADLLDSNLSAGAARTLRFADGEIRTLPETTPNEWTDNLVGAQYLAFPEGSTVQVDIRLQAVSAPPDGLRLKLTLRQFEYEVTAIDPPVFPLLQSGESCHIRFSFTNESARQGFSFHLTGSGRDAQIRLDAFDVTVVSQG